MGRTPNAHLKVRKSEEGAELAVGLQMTSMCLFNVHRSSLFHEIGPTGSDNAATASRSPCIRLKKRCRVLCISSSLPNFSFIFHFYLSCLLPLDHFPVSAITIPSLPRVSPRSSSFTASIKASREIPHHTSRCDETSTAQEPRPTEFLLSIKLLFLFLLYNRLLMHIHLISVTVWKAFLVPSPFVQ